MTKINICGNDYTVPKPVASYLAEACDALVQERDELVMIQAGTVFEDRSDPMAVFSQKYNELMSHAYQWRMLCNQIGFGWGNHYSEVINEIIRLGPSGLTSGSTLTGGSSPVEGDADNQSPAVTPAGR